MNNDEIFKEVSDSIFIVLLYGIIALILQDILTVLGVGLLFMLYPSSLMIVFGHGALTAGCMLALWWFWSRDQESRQGNTVKKMIYLLAWAWVLIFGVMFTFFHFGLLLGLLASLTILLTISVFGQYQLIYYSLLCWYLFIQWRFRSSQ